MRSFGAITTPTPASITAKVVTMIDPSRCFLNAQVGMRKSEFKEYPFYLSDYHVGQIKYNGNNKACKCSKVIFSSVIYLIGTVKGEGL